VASPRARGVPLGWWVATVAIVGGGSWVEMRGAYGGREGRRAGVVVALVLRLLGRPSGVGISLLWLLDVTRSFKS
jgi:hypothetical protein